MTAYVKQSPMLNNIVCRSDIQLVGEQRIKQSLILNNIVCRGDHWSPFFIAVDNRNWTVVAKINHLSKNLSAIYR